MKSSFLSGSPVLRRWLPWAMWALAAGIAIPLGLSQAGVGSSPAAIDAHVASLSPMRTDHRLRVSKILVVPGQRVKAGELLVQMDTTEVDSDLAIAQAKLAYIEITAGWQQVRLLDAHARTTHALSSTAERAAVDVARIIAEAERDRAELSQLDVNLSAEQQLVGDQLTSSERLKAFKLQRAALSKKVSEYRQAVAQARKSASGSTRRLGELTKDSKADVPTNGVQSDVRTAARELQRQQILQLELLRKFHEIRAPFDGRVGEIFCRVGELSADPTSPVVTVVEEQSKTAIAYLAQSNAKKVRPGDTVRLVARDLASPALTGHVTAVAPSITELPIRFRRLPNVPEFGRNVYVELDAPADLPGQAFDAVFRHGTGGGT
jgi:multidrug resistance efflux pump